MTACRSRKWPRRLLGILCEHLRTVDKQTTSKSSKFLNACRALNLSAIAARPLARMPLEQIPFSLVHTQRR